MGKIRRRHCKGRLKISTIAKFQSNLLKAYGDRAPRSCEIFQTFCLDGHWWGASLGAQFSQIYLGSRKTYTKYVSLTALIFGNVTNLKALFPLWCRPIFPNWSVSKIEKTVFLQRTPRSTIWTPGTGYGRVDWNRSWYPSLLAGKRYSDTVFNIGWDLPVDQCDATFNSFLAHGWRRGSRMALDHSLSLIYSLNSGLKIRLLPPLLCIAFVPSASCAYVFGRL